MRTHARKPKPPLRLFYGLLTLVSEIVLRLFFYVSPETCPAMTVATVCFRLSVSAHCFVARHHWDTTVMLRCDMLSLPLFWSAHMSPLFLQSTRSTRRVNNRSDDKQLL